MTISWRTATGLTAAGSSSLTTWSLPTGHTSGDILIAIYGGKPYTATSGVPTDYTSRGSVTSGTNGNANGSGSLRCQVFTKTHDGTESAPTSTLTATPSPSMTAMLAGSKTSAGTWLLASTTGADSTLTGTAISATGADSLTVRTGERVVVVSVANDNLETESAVGLAIGSATFTITEVLATNTTTSGNDGAMHVYDCLVTAGGTGAPVFTATSARSGNSERAVVFLQLWEPVNVAQTDPVGVTDSLTITISQVITDPIGTTDQASRVISAGVDAVGVADALFVEKGWYATETGIGVTDTRAITATFTLADSIGLSDVDQPTHQLIGGVTLIEDDEDVTDAVVKSQSVPVADSVGVADSLFVEEGVYQTETGIGITDAAVAGPNILITDDTGLIALEPTLGDSDFIYSVTVGPETVGLTDALFVERGLYYTEGYIGFADDEIIPVKTGPTNFSPLIEDNIGLIDSGGYFDVADELDTEAIGVTDSIAVHQRVPVSDSIGTTDSLIKNQTISLVDQATTDVDEVTVYKPTGITYDISARTETVGITDIDQPTVSLYTPATTSVTVEDSVGVVDPPPDADWTGFSARGVNEKEGVTDALTASRAVALTDGIGVTDASLLPSHGITIPIDAVGLTDSVTLRRLHSLSDLVRITHETPDVAHERRGYIQQPVNDEVDLTDEVSIRLRRAVTVSDVLDVIDTVALRSPSMRLCVNDILGVREDVDESGWTRTWRLSPPTIDEAPIGGGRLFAFFKMPRGISLLVTGETVTEKRFPSQDDLEACDTYYLGGHVAELTEDEAQVLIDAGYSANLEQVLTPTF